MFSASDDSAMMKQVQGTHAPDGREIDVKHIIQIVDEILIQVIARGVEGHDVKDNTVTCFCYNSIFFILFYLTLLRFVVCVQII